MTAKEANKLANEVLENSDISSHLRAIEIRARQGLFDWKGAITTKNQEKELSNLGYKVVRLSLISFRNELEETEKVDISW